MFFEILFEFLSADDVIYSTFYQSNNQSEKTRTKFSLFVLEYDLKHGLVKIIVNMEIIEMVDEKKRKNPTLALILSAIFPGLGQIYVEKLHKGLILIFLNLIISTLLYEPSKMLVENLDKFPEQSPNNSLLLIVCGYLLALLVLLIYAIVDAKKTAERINKELEA